MLIFGLAIAFGFAAADQARRREASAALWGIATGLLCCIATAAGGLLAVVPAGLLLVLAAAKLGTTTKACPNCGKETKIDSLACVHCGASPKASLANAG